MLFGITALLTIALICSLLLRRRSASVRHSVLAAAILGVLVVPLLLPMLPHYHLRTLPQKPQVERQQERAASVGGTPPQLAGANVNPEVPLRSTCGSLEFVEIAESFEGANNSSSVEGGHFAQQNGGEVSHGWSGLTLLFTLWAGGAALLFLRLALSLRAAQKIVAKTMPMEEPMLRTIARRLTIAQSVALRQSEVGIVPFTFGLRKPVIVLPESANHWTAEERRVVLTHELSHVARRDVFWQFLAAVCCAVYWFHPFVWLTAWRLRIEREVACDDLVVLAGEEPPTYASLLLRLAGGLKNTLSRRHVLGCTVAMARHHEVKQRIAAILNPNLFRKPLGRFGAAVFLCVAICAIVLTSTISPFAKTQETQEPQLAGANVNPEVPLRSTSGSLGEEQDTVQITGRFVSESGEPIPNVVILAQWRDRDRFSPVTMFNILADNNGKFSLAGGKGQRAVVLAQHDDFVLKRFSAKDHEDERSEIPLGDIVLKSGFHPSIQVLDKGGKPVSNVWVELKMVTSQEELETQNREMQAKQDAQARVGLTAAERRAEVNRLMSETSDQTRNESSERLDRSLLSMYEVDEALTDAEGKAIFSPVEAGNFFAKVVVGPSHTGRLSRSGDNISATPSRFLALRKPIKGVYEAAALTLSPTSPTGTIQEVKSINVTVHFSGTAVLGCTPHASISGGRDKEVSSDFAQATTSSLYGSKSLGKDKILLEIPMRLREATLNPRAILPGAPHREFDNEIAYRCFIDGKEIEQERLAWSYSFPLEPFDSDKDIQVAVYKAPLITLHAVDEEGKPITEFFAGAQYIRHGLIPEVTWDTEGVRLENVHKTSHTRSGHSAIQWTRLVGKHGHLYSGLDIEFGWRNVSVDAARINADAILPDEELRLYVVAKGYDVVEQVIPKLTEGEERELTVTLKRCTQ